MSWIEAHAFTLLWILTAAITAIPVFGNIAIKVLRRGGRQSPAANWLARMIPFVLDVLHFAKDVMQARENEARKERSMKDTLDDVESKRLQDEDTK